MNKASKHIILTVIIIIALSGVGISNYSNVVSASESNLVGYNQKYGNDTNSADHTPAASNPSDVYISHSDSSGFEYKVPGDKTTYYADKNSPLYKQIHNQHGSNSTGKETVYHHSSNSDKPISKSQMPTLPVSKSKPKHNKTTTKITVTKPRLNKNGKRLLLIHRGIMATGIAVVLLGIIYGINKLIKQYKYKKQSY